MGGSGILGYDTPPTMIGTEPWRTELRGAPLSVGSQAIDAMGRRDTAAQALWERGLLEQANDDNEFLKTFANPGMRLNIQGTPRTPAEARRNAIIASQQLQQRKTLVDAGKQAVANAQYQQRLADRERALAEQRQEMALARARLGQQARRDALGNIVQGRRLDLDARKAAELARYRDRALTSREGLSRERMRATENRADQTSYDKDIQQAIKAITEFGMDPDEAADVWDLDDADRERLYAYGDIVDEGLSEEDQAAALEAEQMAQYLNTKALPVRQSLRDSGKSGPIVNGRKLPLPNLGPEDQIPLMEELIKMKGLGKVRLGPTGFEPVLRRRTQTQASTPRQPIVGAPSRGLTFAENGLPIVLTPEHLAQVPRGKRFMDGRGRIRVK